MSIEKKNIIDYISEKNGKKVLVISDHLLWGNMMHLYQLQEKINMYLSAIETGQLATYYPNAKNGFIICLYLQYEPDKTGLLFLDKITEFINNQGYDFEYVIYDEVVAYIAQYAYDPSSLPESTTKMSSLRNFNKS